MKKFTFIKIYKAILVAGGIIGLVAASILTIEKIHLASDPNYIPSCSLSPVVACSPVIGSKQASAFGFPNPIIGIAGFAMVWAVGMMLFAGAKNLKKWFWWCFQAGTTFGILFCAWLLSQSLYEIGKLCIYCMIVWAVTVPIFWTTLAYNIREKNIKSSTKLATWVAANPGKLVALTYLLVVILVFTRFADYFHSFI